MKLVIDTLNFSWHCNMMCEDPENFHSFAKAFFILSLKYWQTASFNEIIYAMDKGSFRYEIYPAYKGKRKEKRAKDEEAGIKPAFKLSHVFMIQELLESVSIPFIYKENYEADDIIASIINQGKIQDPNLKQVVLSTDGDYEQLVTSPNIYLLKYKNGFMNHKTILEKYEGKDGDDILNIKALMGDNSDNIIGMKGVALKTSLALMKPHKSLHDLDEFFQNNPDHRFAKSWDLERFLLNKRVMKMVDNIELNYDPFEYAIKDHAKELFAKYDLEFIFDRIKNLYSSKKINFKTF